MQDKITKAFNIDTNKKLITFFSLGFLICMFVFISFYLFNDRLFLWKIDGLEQQYPFFIFYGKWLRELIENITTLNFTIPMWTEYVGYGADYLFSVFSCLGNPINLLAFFSNKQNAEYILYLTVPLTLYLSGISFIALCNYFKFEKFYIFFATLTYCFAGYSFIAFSQIFMLYPLILAPLTALGLEKIFKENKYILFTIAMILNFSYSVDHSLNVFVLVVIYFVVRSFISEDKFNFTKFLIRVVKVFLTSLIAFIIASPLLIPQVIGVMQNSRLGLKRPFDPFYTSPYYSKTVGLYLGVAQVGPDCYSGFFSISIFCILVMLFRKNKDKSSIRLLTLLTIFTAITLIPICGRIFNGFTYANNRWIWGYTLLVSFIIVKESKNISSFIKKDKFKAFVLVYIVVNILVFPSILSTEHNIAEFNFKIISYFILFGVLLVFVTINSKSLLRCYLFILLLVSIGFNCYIDATNITQGFTHNVKIGEAYATVAENSMALISYKNQTENSKFDYFVQNPPLNYNQVNDTKASSFYNSFYNSNIDQLHNALGLTSSDINFAFSSLDGRTPLELFCQVTNLITQKNNNINPQIWEQQETNSSYNNLYKSINEFPKFFSYKDSISEDEFYKHSFTERQAILLDKLVVENNANSNLATDEYYTYPIDLEINNILKSNHAKENINFDTSANYSNLVEIQNNKIITKKDNLAVYINTNIPACSDAYLNIKNIECLNPETDGRPTLNFTIDIFADNFKDTIYERNSAHQLYSEKKDWSVHLGYSNNERQTIVLKFSNAGSYVFDNISLELTNLQKETSSIKKICTNSIQDMKQSPNGFSCNTNTNANNEYLFFSIPYSEGWSAIVDGKPHELNKGNIAFMYMKLEPGQHQIELKYETPGLKNSLILSTLTIFITIIAFLVYYKYTCTNRQNV